MAKKEANTKKEKKKEVKVKKHFFKDFKAELKKVIWPTPKQLINNTIVVIAIVLITALLVAAFDLIFREANTYGIYKLQTYVDEKYNTEEEENDSESTENTESTESSEETETTEGTTDNTNSGTESSGETNIEVENNTEQAQ